MRPLLLLTLFALSTACASSRSAQPMAGTYSVWLCAAECAARDTANAAVAGYLVLSESSFPPESFSNAILGKSLFLRSRNGVPNACFRLERRGNIKLLAGIIPAGVTTWSVRGDTVSVLLYASPDAFFTLNAIVKGGYLLGFGRASGFIGNSFDERTGPAHGVRIGDADVTQCQSRRE